MMRFPSAFSPVRCCTVAFGVAIVVVLSACASGRQAATARAAGGCEFIVYNQTPMALEIRLRARSISTGPIGSMNPGELLTWSLPCEDRQVGVAGIAIPWQTGALVEGFGAVYGEARLVRGERARVALAWP